MTDTDLQAVCQASDAFTDTVYTLNLLHKQVGDSDEPREASPLSELVAAAHQTMEALEAKLDEAASLAEMVELLDKATVTVKQLRDRMVDGLVATVPVPDHPPAE